MFCKNCGKLITEDGLFCEFCGSRVDKIKQEKPILEEKKSKTPARKLETSDNAKEKSIHSTEKLEQAYYYLLLIDQAKKTANFQMLKGIGWALLGGLITFITYSMASEGGTYFVFWGLVIYGVYIFIKGLYYRISPKSLLKKAYGTIPDNNNKEEIQ